MFRMKKLLLLIICAVILVPLAWMLIYRFEGSPPEVTADLPTRFVKDGVTLSLDINDHKTGLREIHVRLIQKQITKTLLKKTYPAGFLLAPFSGAPPVEDRLVIPVETGRHGLIDGDAMIQVQVTDQSWRGWNHGNLAEKEIPIIIDTESPRVEVLSRQHNVERGGSGLVIYRLFENDINSGVQVGDRFFPGHSGLFDQAGIYAALFALDHTQGPGTRISITAKDPAGNVTRKGFYHYIRDRGFKSDALKISDAFLEKTMPDFQLGDLESRIKKSDHPLLEKFLVVNTALRNANVDKVLSVPVDTLPEMMWQDKFERMPGATRAGFGDQRTYTYNGKEIGQSRHMGIDLASTAQSPVGAANAGRVILAEPVGIFGNTVIIDHGFGLASLYSHLSHMAVSVGDTVQKGHVIGNTGMTGLAAGDHLHFSMIVHNVFVNPLEWWDPNWIENNITAKIRAVNEGSS
jgi:murein DD-endopeptidase MepM/ murein hydrolase activator NlpD